jgi:hypothetical protein
MGINLVCSCGTPLWAGDAMAARHIECPRCGAVVGVPSLQVARPGSEANWVMAEEGRHGARLPSPRTVADAEEVVHALRAWPQVVGLGLAWAACVACPAALLPALHNPPADPALLLPLAGCWLLVTLALAGVTSGLLDCTLAGAATGEAPRMPWPETDLLVVLRRLGRWVCTVAASWGRRRSRADDRVEFVRRSLGLGPTAAGHGRRVPRRQPAGGPRGRGGAALGRAVTDLLLEVRTLGRWLFAFLAGPAPLAVAGFFYWLHGGDLGLLDWLILAEMGVLAVSYWVLAVAAAGERERWLDANPLAVARLVARLGDRALVVAVAALVALAHGWLAVAALAEVYRSAWAWLWLACGGLSGLFLATFLFRLLGVGCYGRPALPPWDRSSPEL